MRDIRVLYTSADVHRAIASLLMNPKEKDRRVVIVAYVGAGAASYLPSPKNLDIVCAPQPGSTSARAIRDLLRAGAQVRFSDRLHMKVYWSSLRGCVITSANASTSAMGRNGLREAGVLLAPGSVDIDRLLKSAAPRARTAREMRELDRVPPRTNGSKGRAESKPYDFNDWYESADRQAWLQSWWDADDDTDVSDAGKVWAGETYGARRTSYLDLLQHKRGQIKLADWILTYWTKGTTSGPPAWMYVDHVHPVPKGDSQYNSYYPFEALQARPLSQCPTPPFQITPAFRTAFRRAVREYGLKRLTATDSMVPRAALIEAIRRQMASGSSVAR